MFHTKKQVDDIRNLHIGAGILIYRNSDREVIEEKIIIVNGELRNAGSGKLVEFSIVVEE